MPAVAIYISTAKVRGVTQPSGAPSHFLRSGPLKLITKNSNCRGPLPPVGPPSLDAAATPSLGYWPKSVVGKGNFEQLQSSQQQADGCICLARHYFLLVFSNDLGFRNIVELKICIIAISTKKKKNIAGYV